MCHEIFICLTYLVSLSLHYSSHYDRPILEVDARRLLSLLPQPMHQCMLLVSTTPSTMDPLTSSQTPRVPRTALLLWPKSSTRTTVSLRDWWPLFMLLLPLSLLLMDHLREARTGVEDGMWISVLRSSLTLTQPYTSCFVSIQCCNCQLDPLFHWCR